MISFVPKKRCFIHLFVRCLCKLLWPIQSLAFIIGKYSMRVVICCWLFQTFVAYDGVCVCVRESVCERVCERVCVRESVCMRECVCERVYVWVCVRECVWECVCERERGVCVRVCVCGILILLLVVRAQGGWCYVYTRFDHSQNMPTFEVERVPMTAPKSCVLPKCKVYKLRACPIGLPTSPVIFSRPCKPLAVHLLCSGILQSCQRSLEWTHCGLNFKLGLGVSLENLGMCPKQDFTYIRRSFLMAKAVTIQAEDSFQKLIPEPWVPLLLCASVPNSEPFALLKKIGDLQYSIRLLWIFQM